jgi:hypothetical protein
MDKNTHGLCIMFCVNKFDGGEINIKDQVESQPCISGNGYNVD